MNLQSEQDISFNFIHLFLENNRNMMESMLDILKDNQKQIKRIGKRVEHLETGLRNLTKLSIMSQNISQNIVPCDSKPKSASLNEDIEQSHKNHSAELNNQTRKLKRNHSASEKEPGIAISDEKQINENQNCKLLSHSGYRFPVKMTFPRTQKPMCSERTKIPNEHQVKTVAKHQFHPNILSYGIAKRTQKISPIKTETNARMQEANEKIRQVRNIERPFQKHKRPTIDSIGVTNPESDRLQRKREHEREREPDKSQTMEGKRAARCSTLDTELQGSAEGRKTFTDQDFNDAMSYLNQTLVLKPLMYELYI